MDDRQQECERSRRPFLVAACVLAVAMVALPVYFVVPDQVAVAVAAPPQPSCARLGPDFHPVRVRGPSGRTNVVCALFGFVGGEP